jgi:uncharacterized protein (TIGR02145 family)
MTWTSSTSGSAVNSTTSTLSSTDVPGNANFILAPNDPYDWRDPQNDNLWQGVSGSNNPCPSGYRLPTETELNSEIESWSSRNATGAIGSPLKLPVGGYRDGSNGSLDNVGSDGVYWSSTFSGTSSQFLNFYSFNARVFPNNRASGFSVRCIAAGHPSSDGSAVVSAYTCSTASTGSMAAGSPVSGVTQTITATVTTVGTYIITATANGVTFAGSGTFAETGAQEIVLTATGTPTAAGSHSFTLNTTPDCSFNRTTPTVLEQIGNEGDNPDEVTSRVTVAQINTISPAITGAISGNEAAYQAYIDANPNLFSSPATVTEVQAMVDVVNAAVNASATVLAQIGAEGDDPNSVTSLVTVAQINTISPAITGAIIDNEAAYQAYIDANPYSFDEPATVEQVQAMVNTVNSSNGTALVSAYTCNTASAGIMKVGVDVAGVVTQTITATVTTVGTYNISTTTANGVTFAASGTFAGTGDQTIELIATGTPTSKGSNSFILNTTPDCSFSRYASVTGAYANVNGVIKDFMTDNLGANGSIYQGYSYDFDLYQWGRQADGHELRTSTTQAGPVAAPVANKFITNASSPYNWRNPSSNTLWGDGTKGADPAKAANDPCPTGFKVPSQAQWSGLFKLNSLSGGSPSSATQNKWTWINSVGGYALSPIGAASPVTLFLPADGLRAYNGNIVNVSSFGFYWSSSTFNNNNSYTVSFNQSNVNPASQDQRANGNSVRCIAVDNPSTNGTAVVSGYTSTGSAGTMTAGTPVSGVTQTITANVTTVGTYGITAKANGVTFFATGTFAGTGPQTIELNATGTPTYGTTDAFILNTTPNFSFDRTTTGDATTNGTAVVSAYTCSTNSAGTMTAGTPVSGVTQTITATVTAMGTYNISTTTANGVTFSGSGTFAETGAQEIMLTATGTPTDLGSHSFTLNTTPDCSFNRTTLTVSETVLAQIGAEGDDPNNVISVVTVDQINAISPAITDAISDNEVAYQAYIDANPNSFASPATAAEVQAMVDVVNAAVNASATVLAQIGAEGDDPNDVLSVVTVDQINTIFPAITGAISGNEAAYQAYIDANPYSFDEPATSDQVQAMVDVVNAAVNASATVLAQIGAEADSPTIPSEVTVDQINTISPAITGAISDNEAAYQAYIDANPNSFASPATAAQVQAMVDVVNTSNGTALVSAYTCNTASAGSMILGTAVSGVTQTITANVTTVGTYSISITENGVTFAGSGTFAVPGAQDIVLSATGTPTSSYSTFILNTTPTCSFVRTATTAIVDVVNPVTGETWMDRNLGAVRAATSSTDEDAYGDLYQWGRGADGHQIRTSGIAAGPIASPWTSTNFITNSIAPSDWRTPQDDNLWQGVSGTNSPCPSGYRLPTEAELTAERLSWGSSNATGAFASPLKLPLAGSRQNGYLANVDNLGVYWSSKVSGANSRFLYFYNNFATVRDDFPRNTGLSVRCIKD